MPDDMTAQDVATGPAAPRIDPRPLLAYIEEMLLELAQLASGVGESGLAASLAVTAIQAGAAAGRR